MAAVGDRMQQQRFELKYIFDNETALRVRDFVQCYLGLDEYSVCQPNLSYPVHSIYLDNQELQTYWETINGNKNRFKLRLRFYSAHQDAPVFFEIKRRLNSIIMKQRGGVRLEYVPHLLAGHIPEPKHLLSPNNAKHIVALNRFCELMTKINARPMVHIAYQREAYVSEDDTVRVTMDRLVRAEPHSLLGVKTDMVNPKYCFRGFGKDYVILELKFTNRYPNWFRELVRVFNIMQRGAAKYCSALAVLGEHSIHSAVPVAQDEENWLEEIDGSPA